MMAEDESPEDVEEEEGIPLATTQPPQYDSQPLSSANYREYMYRRTGMPSFDYTNRGCRQNRYLLMAAACCQTLTCSVVIFGWPNIEPVLIKKGVFLNECQPDDLSGSDQSCAAQVERLSLIFTVASAVSYAFNLVNGLVLDRFGVKITVLYGLGLWVIGLLLLAFGLSGGLVNVNYNVPRKERAAQPSSASEAAVFFSGFSFIGATAVSLLHPMYSLGNLFPKIKNSIVTTLNGCGDSSAIMFLIMRMLYFNAGLSLFAICIGYIIGPVLMCTLFAVLLWPRWPFKSALELQLREKSNFRYREADKPVDQQGMLDDSAEETHANGHWIEMQSKRRSSDLNEGNKKERSKEQALVSNEDLQEEGEHGDETNDAETITRQRYPYLGKPFREQLFTVRFFGGTVFTWINILKFNYFFVSLNSILRDFGDEDGSYTQAFGWISLGGIFAVFVTGTIIDKYGIVGGFWGSNISGILLSVFTLIPVLQLQVVSFLVFVIFRSFLFSITAAFISSEFGFTNLGKLIGVTYFTGGAVGFLAQPLLQLGLHPSDSEGHNFNVPGAIMLALTLLQTIFPVVYTYWNRRTITFPTWVQSVLAKVTGNTGSDTPVAGSSSGYLGFK
eukprot:gb/GECG01005752.1/.p1 GENE.gb/GECG01005752.1/~~gb/GECG01005752.1/.p1  ORF type:complete len:615 (+),score=66.71 gb/GECG01005752.1/:1-1845(+)